MPRAGADAGPGQQAQGDADDEVVDAEIVDEETEVTGRERAASSPIRRSSAANAATSVSEDDS